MRADLVLAVLLAVTAVVGSRGAAEVSHPAAPLDPAGYALVVVAALALAVRRRKPLVALVVAALCTAGYLAMGYPYGPILALMMFAVYSAARHAPLRAALWCAVAALPLLVIHLFTSEGRLGWLGVVPVIAWVVVPATVGYGLRLRSAAARQARAETIRRSVDDERLRISQEVHDIVGHGLAAIKMQADVALHVMARNPGHARPALEAISRSSQQALDELRSTLATTRDGTPAAGLGGLDQLLRRMVDAGVDVHLHTDGERDRVLPPAVDLAAYRVVQESLTNVLRHGDGGPADLTIRYRPDSVTISVVNPLTGTPRPGTGSGITGMRARVEALGGQVTAGPVERRFEVSARLPLGAPA
ncbi:two-component sensor histidine kinase [Actinoplanes lobatus]|uniref:histidine kinase n=1 Tax=Actinoplanes lobatus TaxID=113568 RepID=A0A7W7HGA4_9ACTN|nr:histidine kinase [Actinoplanes lobatus]MBB4750009.1 signal transduction histidine kinase [Actinoplanes lobatus]GGN74767.1 two-component sensor histidine kinase [Actinoplanes lobatus]GIE39101.1 two-component sensor histidine kinase [Actinoplanes lobatus]